MEPLINYNGMCDKILREMSKSEFIVTVIKRAETIIQSELSGESSKPHNLEGVELVARAISIRIKDDGACHIVRDFGTDMDSLVRRINS